MRRSGARTHSRPAAGTPRSITPLVVAALLVASLGSLAAPSAVRAAWASDSFSTADEDFMVQLVNQARANAGLAPVAVSTAVHDVARWRSKDMIDRDFFSHAIPPEGYAVDYYMKQRGIAFWWWGETISKNAYSDSSSTESAFNWFMGSSPHRAIILEPRATHLGVGAYKGTWQSSANTHMYTMVFIQAPPTGETTPPTVTAPKSRLYYTTTLGSSTTPVRTRWSASDASGIAKYQLQRQVNGGTWSSVTLSSATAKSIAQSLTIGYTYRYRVRATDGAGNRSAWSYGPAFAPRRAQQTAASVTYGGTWTTVSASYVSGGSLGYATQAGAWASYTFTGYSVAWVAFRGPNRGSANVYLDGVFAKTISLYASTYSAKPIAYAASWGSNGTHTIKIVVVGTAGHPRIDLDAFVRLVGF